MIILSTKNSVYYINEKTKEMSGGKLPSNKSFVLKAIPPIMLGERNNLEFTNGMVISTVVKSVNTVGHLA